jgi:hypothetical protein
MITELQGPRDSRDTSEHCGKIKDEQGALRSLDNHLMGGMAIVVRVSIKAMKVRTVAITESLHEADLASGGGRTRERRTHHAAIGSTPTRTHRLGAPFLFWATGERNTLIHSWTLP